MKKITKKINVVVILIVFVVNILITNFSFAVDGFQEINENMQTVIQDKYKDLTDTEKENTEWNYDDYSVKGDDYKNTDFYKNATEAQKELYDTYANNFNIKLMQMRTENWPLGKSIGDSQSSGNTGSFDQEQIQDNDFTDSDEDWDKLGGTLLRPFVAFVNFIADTVMYWTGKFMYPEKYNTGDSNAIMVGTAPDLGYKSVQDFPDPIDTSNFASITNNYYPNFKYTPEEIFSGKVDLLSIDFISGKDSSNNPIKDEGWNAIRQVVASWYKVLRMMAIVALLSVLIYTGIKILISANAKDKAKYKEWIINWFVAVGILFTMHYIMSFTITVINSFSNLMQSNFSGIGVKTSKLGDFTTNLMGFVRFRRESNSKSRIFGNVYSISMVYIKIYICILKKGNKYGFSYTNCSDCSCYLSDR